LLLVWKGCEPTVPISLRSRMRVDEGLVKNGEIPLKTRPATAEED
jgi:hypothetical protein